MYRALNNNFKVDNDLGRAVFFQVRVRAIRKCSRYGNTKTASW